MQKNIGKNNYIYDNKNVFFKNRSIETIWQKEEKGNLKGNLLIPATLVNIPYIHTYSLYIKYRNTYPQ